MSKVLVNETSLTAIGEAIREKNGSEDKYKPSEMAAAIGAIETGGGDMPEEAFTITGGCNYRFGNGGWDWFIRDFGNKVKTVDIDNLANMFLKTTVEEIPFEINCIKANSTSNIIASYLFQNAYNLTTIPKINNCKPSNLTYAFSSCRSLRELPNDIDSWFDWSYFETNANASCGGLIRECYSLRSVPMELFSHNKLTTSTSSVPFSYMLYNCASLDEAVNIPISNKNSVFQSNIFSNTFSGAARLKNITFETPNGAPVVVQWKSQTIDLTTVGYASSTTVASYITNYNSGITTDKKVTNATQYSALKNDDDWYTTDYYYSRYNHDSAVATINSLPDTSAFLATYGGTNTIKFKKFAGKNSGGEINNLTAEEIAVATAKGWTVSLS